MVVCVDWDINAFAPLVKTLPPRSATTPACFPLTLSSWLFHVNHRKRFAVHQRDRYGLHGDIAFCAEELRPRQGCPHLEASKSGGPRRILAGLQDHAADSAPSPVWMDEKRANPRGIAKRVQKRILAPGPVVTPVKRLALAPAAATDDCPSGLRVFSASAFECARLGLCHDVRSVSDELAINAKNGLERAFRSAPVCSPALATHAQTLRSICGEWEHLQE